MPPKKTATAAKPKRKTAPKSQAAAAKVKVSSVSKPADKPLTKTPSAFTKTTRPVKPMRERPLSPHLSIYRPQITSMLSIAHRATGVFLYLGAYVLAALLFSLNFGQGNLYNQLMVCLTSLPGQILLYAYLFALFYHMCNGIRHLMWDIGKGFSLTNVTLSGLAVIAAALSLTFAVWFQFHPQYIARLLP